MAAPLPAAPPHEAASAAPMTVLQRSHCCKLSVMVWAAVYFQPRNPLLHDPRCWRSTPLLHRSLLGHQAKTRPRRASAAAALRGQVQNRMYHQLCSKNIIRNCDSITPSRLHYYPPWKPHLLLSCVFLGVARRLELSPCNTITLRGSRTVARAVRVPKPCGAPSATWHGRTATLHSHESRSLLRLPSRLGGRRRGLKRPIGCVLGRMCLIM